MTAAIEIRQHFHIRPTKRNQGKQRNSAETLRSWYKIAARCAGTLYELGG